MKRRRPVYICMRMRRSSIKSAVGGEGDTRRVGYCRGMDTLADGSGRKCMRATTECEETRRRLTENYPGVEGRAYEVRGAKAKETTNSGISKGGMIWWTMRGVVGVVQKGRPSPTCVFACFCRPRHFIPMILALLARTLPPLRQLILRYRTLAMHADKVFALEHMGQRGGNMRQGNATHWSFRRLVCTCTCCPASASRGSHNTRR